MPYPCLATPPTSPPTADEIAAGTRREAAYDDATSSLAAARRHFERAIDDHDRDATAIAERIDDAVHDDLLDGRWAGFTEWVSRNAGWIKKVTEVLSVIATALAVVALFIPGVNLVAILAIGLTVGVRAAHTALASTGNGSWADVALDGFALATLGVGRVAARGIQGAQMATRQAAASAVRRSVSRRAASFNRRIALRSHRGGSCSSCAAVRPRRSPCAGAGPPRTVSWSSPSRPGQSSWLLWPASSGSGGGCPSVPSPWLRSRCWWRSGDADWQSAQHDTPRARPRAARHRPDRARGACDVGVVGDDTGAGRRLRRGRVARRPQGVPGRRLAQRRGLGARGCGEVVGDGALAPQDLASTVDMLVALANFAGEDLDTDYTYLHWPRPAQVPLPVTLTTFDPDGDEEEALRHLTHADDPLAVEAPLVERVEVPGLGAGLKVMRYVNDGDDYGILAYLIYAWRGAPTFRSAPRALTCRG